MDIFRGLRRTITLCPGLNSGKTLLPSDAADVPQLSTTTPTPESGSHSFPVPKQSYPSGPDTRDTRTEDGRRGKTAAMMNPDSNDLKGRDACWA